MNKKKVFLHENKVNMPKLITFYDKIELDSEKRNLHSKRSKRKIITNDKTNNNNLLSNNKYYKSFFKKYNTNKRIDIKPKQIKVENKKNIQRITPPLIQINSSSFLLNDNVDNIDKNSNLNQVLIQKTFSNVIDKNKEKDKINPLTFSINDIDQNLDNKTRRTEYKTNDKKKNNLLYISLSDYFNKSQSLLSSHTHNDRTPNTLNNISSVKKKNFKKQISSVSSKNLNQNHIMNKSQKINDKKDNIVNYSKIIYKKGNFLNVKKIDLKGRNKKEEEENIFSLFENNCKKETIDNNKKENTFIGPKKKKFLFCCIPLN